MAQHTASNGSGPRPCGFGCSALSPTPDPPPAPHVPTTSMLPHLTFLGMLLRLCLVPEVNSAG